MGDMDLSRAEEARLAALEGAPKEHWIALSADETRVVAQAETFEALAELLTKLDERDPLILFVPEDWLPRVL